MSRDRERSGSDCPMPGGSEGVAGSGGRKHGSAPDGPALGPQGNDHTAEIMKGAEKNGAEKNP